MATKNPLTRIRQAAPSRRGASASEAPTTVQGPAAAAAPGAGSGAEEPTVDLQRRRDQLQAKVAELQWDLGGMVYEMAVRDRIRVDVIIKHAAQLQDADAELAEIDRIMALETSGTAGACPNCGAPHSSGAAFCWQCGNQILHQVDTSAIFGA